MSPMMFTHINQTNGYLCHIDGSFRYRFRRPDDGNNGTIVVRVAGIIQDLQPGNLAGFINNLFYLCFVTAFTEIRNKFNQLLAI